MLGCVPGNKLSSSLATPELLLGSVLTEIRGGEKIDPASFSLCKIALNVFQGRKGPAGAGLSTCSCRRKENELCSLF